MPRNLYCFRLRKTVPLLTDDEFERVAPYLRSRISAIMKYRKDQGGSIDEAGEHYPEGEKALDVYEEMTGHRLEHPKDLGVVRLSMYGRLCPECGSPFRTPRAKLCAECGYHLPQGEVAGLIPTQ